MFPRQVLYQLSHLQPGFYYMLMRAFIWVYTQMLSCYVFMTEKEGGERGGPFSASLGNDGLSRPYLTTTQSPQH